MFIDGGSITLYNVTVALNSSGVFQIGGTVNAYNPCSPTTDTPAPASVPTGADY